MEVVEVAFFLVNEEVEEAKAVAAEDSTLGTEVATTKAEVEKGTVAAAVAVSVVTEAAGFLVLKVTVKVDLKKKV